MLLKEDEQDFESWADNYKKHCMEHGCADAYQFLMNWHAVMNKYNEYVKIDCRFDKLSDEEKDSLFVVKFLA